MHKSDRRSLLFLVSLFVIIAALTGFFADTEYSNDTPDIPTDSIMHKQSSQHKAYAADVYAVPKFTNARKTLPTYMGLPPKTTSAWLLTYASRATIFLPHLWLR